MKRKNEFDRIDKRGFRINWNILIICIGVLAIMLTGFAYAAKLNVLDEASIMQRQAEAVELIQQIL